MDTTRAIDLARELARKQNELVAQIERELTKEPEHYNGEPCNLSVWDLSYKKLPEGRRLVYTGEYKVRQTKEWAEFTDKDDTPVASYGTNTTPQWILREEPIECHNEEPITPKPRKGTVCDAPRDEDVPKEGVFIFRDDEKQLPKKGDYALGECGCTNDMIFQAAYEFGPDNTRYILTHIMPKFNVGDEVTYGPTNYTFTIKSSRYQEGFYRYVYSEHGPSLNYYPEANLVLATPKPEPKFREKQWVSIIDDTRPFHFQILRVRYNLNRFEYQAEYNSWVSEHILRPTKPIDFAKEFNGVKVWMEKHNGVTYEYRYGTGYDGNSSRLNPWEIERNLAAGIPVVPKEVCDEAE